MTTAGKLGVDEGRRSHNFLSLCQLELDTFAPKLSKVKACRLVAKQSWLTGCNKEDGCLQKFRLILVLFYASQLLDNRSSFSGSDQLKDSVIVYLAAVKKGKFQQVLESWGAPPRLPFILTFQEHMVSKLFPPYQDHSFLDLARHLLHTRP